MKHRVKMAAWVVAGLLALLILNKFVVSPALRMIDEQDFREEVRTYLSEIEEPITEAAYRWMSRAEDEEAKDIQVHTRLFERMVHLGNGGRTEFRRYDVDSWNRLHRDIHDEAVLSARLRAAKRTRVDVNIIPKEVWQAELPQDWSDRFRLQYLHKEIHYLSWSNGNETRQLRQEFARHREELDRLMQVLKIAKKAKPVTK